MKKLISMLLVLAMVLSMSAVLSACGGKNDKGNETGASSPAGNNTSTGKVNAETAKAKMLVMLNAYHAGKCDDVAALAPKALWDMMIVAHGKTKEAMIAAFPSYKESLVKKDLYDPDSATFTFGEVKLMSAADIDGIRTDFKTYHKLEISKSATAYVSQVVMKTNTVTYSYEIVALEDGGDWYVFQFDGGYFITLYPKQILDHLGIAAE